MNHESPWSGTFLTSRSGPVRIKLLFCPGEINVLSAPGDFYDDAQLFLIVILQSRAAFSIVTNPASFTI